MVNGKWIQNIFTIYHLPLLKMRYCHECGAIVAPDDTFCSFCGIMLQSVSVADDDSAASVSTGDLPEETNPAAAQVANQTDLAIEAAMKTEPRDTTSQELAAPSLLPEDSGAWKAVPSGSTEKPKAENIKAFEPPVPKIAEPQGDIELETMFGYPTPTRASQDLSPTKAEEPAKLGEPEKIVEPEKVEKVEEQPAKFEQQVKAEELAKVEEPIKAQEQVKVEELIKTQEPVKAQEPPVAGFSSLPQEIPPGSSRVADENTFDEDLQPTLIGQNAELLMREAQQIPAETAPPVEKSEEKTLLSADLPVPAETPKEPKQFTPQVGQNIKSAPPIVESNFAPASIGENPLPKQDLAIPAVVNDAVKPISAQISEEQQANKRRMTHANRPQETPGGKAAKLQPLSEGTVLNNRYKIVRRIGGGGMGAVYLAEDANLGGTLRAVKEMIQAYVDESQQEKAVQDFKRESVLLTQLEHPSIPTIYDYFYDEPNARFYLVMKYISGGDLAARLRAAPEGKLDEGSVTEWSMQIADVLEYLHHRDPPIVYRDLKPSNIMLDTNGKAMLIDFGIARWVNKEEKGVTAVGTMGYAPPELFAGNAEPRSDIYSLGATMFHLLTGADPQSNPLLIFDFTKNPRPRHINPMLSVEMEDILLRAVEYNAGLRFESAAKMRDALREHLDKLRAGRLTFERSQHNIAQVLPIPAQAPPPVPFEQQPQVNMVFCGFCGEKIIATDAFCAYCGAPQQGAGAMPQKQLASQQMMQTMLPQGVGQQQPQTGGVTARLVVLGTQELDAPIFNLEKETNLVGREDRRANIFPEIDLTRYDSKAQVSRRHARIFREGANYMVEDLKSSNGTILVTDDNKTVRLLPNQPHVLQHGDKLKLGETTLRFYVN